MNLTTDIELIQASDLAIDASVIDVSEVENEEDRVLLTAAGAEILQIQAKRDDAIKRVLPPSMAGPTWRWEESSFRCR